MNIFEQINDSIAIHLNNFVLQNHLEKIIWFFSDAPIFFLPVFLLWTWLYWTFKVKNNSKKENILFIFYSVIVAMILNAIIKIFVSIDRPESVIKPILEHVPDKSFPSDHATVSFAFLFALYFAWYKKTFWGFMPFVILMNFSRIAGGLHWFFDIVVWMIIGLLAVIFVFKNTKNKVFVSLNNFVLKITSFIKL